MLRAALHISHSYIEQRSPLLEGQPKVSSPPCPRKSAVTLTKKSSPHFCCLDWPSNWVCTKTADKALSLPSCSPAHFTVLSPGGEMQLCGTIPGLILCGQPLLHRYPLDTLLLTLNMITYHISILVFPLFVTIM